MSVDGATREQTHKELSAVVKAISERNGKRAEALIADHLMRTLATINIWQCARLPVCGNPRHVSCRRSQLRGLRPKLDELLQWKLWERSQVDGELTGKVAIVTGAGRMRSIGRRIATTLAATGGSVVITGTGRAPNSFPEDEKAAGWRDIESVADEIRGKGGTALPLVADISSEASTAEVIRKTLEAFGRLDILVNNAAFGRGRDRVPVVDLDFEVFKKVYDVNVNGTFLMSREAARAMLKQGEGGNIVNVSTVATRTAGPRLGAYASSKLAINGLGRTMAMELAKDNIRVNTICPGFNDTSRLDDMPRDEAFDKLVEDLVPLGWADDGTQVAELTLFLVSDRAKWITGQTLMADGGRIWGH